ncbi:MAG: hypothetical protein M1822_006497 [Bathelium mastoideum]|nr:MAG: hypothetical protein M1822_006497 [Bathelium mastoideum]
MPTFGRGGAGNILSDADVKALNKSISHDLEASQHAAQEASSPSFSSLAAADAEAPDNASLSSRLEQQQQQYRTTGRGGAGNMTTPSESQSLDTAASRGTDNRNDPLAASEQQQQPLSSTSPSSHAAEEANPSVNTASSVPASHIPAYVGRGGAGNYLGEGGGTGIGMSGAKNAQEREVELQEMRVRRGVERAVEEGLSRPPVAHLGGGG